MLQNFLPTKQDQLQQSIEKPTLAQQIPAFVHSLSPLLNDQRSVTHMPQLSQIDSTIDKLTTALPDPLLFTDEKNSSIDQ